MADATQGNTQYSHVKDFNAGRYRSQGSYERFEPTPINRGWVVDDRIVQHLLSQADRSTCTWRTCLTSIWSSVCTWLKRPRKSSRIEGTRTRIQEALLDREDAPQEKRDDWEEVQNYVAAMDVAVKKLDRLPFSTRLIRETHSVLMRGVRGEHKQPGTFRTSQNWIGGATINDAVFVPPVHTAIGDLMSDLEQ